MTHRALQGARKAGRLVYVGVVLIIVTLFYGCEDPGVVGNAIVDDQTRLSFDTLRVSDIATYSTDSYSGNLSYFSIGAYNDELFGDLKAVAGMRPALTQLGDTLTTETQAILSLSIDSTLTYGDTLGTQTFDLVSIGNRWRGNTFKYGSDFELTSDVIARNIDVVGNDTLTVELPDSWKEEYLSYYNRSSSERDSVYLHQYNGFALVPTNSSKILAVRANQSKVLFKNPQDTTFMRQNLDGWGFSLDRDMSNVTNDASKTPVHGTYEAMLDFDFPFSEDTLGSTNLSRVELVWHMDKATLDNTLPANHVRPEPPSIGIFIREEGNLADGFFNQTPSFSAELDEDDYTYRFNFTSYVNTILYSETTDHRFYMSTQANTGVLYSTLIFNDMAGDNQPKLLITSVKAE